ncbi:MAG: class II fructose-bisphosphate aldolase family protein [Patescibacteria group bacterium]|nr:class II fructose-bisphosphate aldolase family protein [Patescibacteria group bacterium]
MLTHIKNIVSVKNKYAIGAFNTYNLEFTKAIVTAAVKENFSLIIQTSENVLRYTGVPELTNLIQTVVQSNSQKVPIAFHLDHGKDINLIKQAIQAGFTSVMFDGSLLSYNENVKKTKRLVQFAHARGVWVQGELGEVIVGRLGIVSQEKRYQGMTDPDQAQDFVEQTGVDTLAVAIGNVHGTYKLYHKVPKLDIQRLKEIKNKIKIPLVLHGGSGISNKDIKAAIQNGIRIININSELKIAFTNGLRRALRSNLKETDPRKYFILSAKEVERVVSKKIQLFKK